MTSPRNRSTIDQGIQPKVVSSTPCFPDVFYAEEAFITFSTLGQVSKLSYKALSPLALSSVYPEFMVVRSVRVSSKPAEFTLLRGRPLGAELHTAVVLGYDPVNLDNPDYRHNSEVEIIPYFFDIEDNAIEAVEQFYSQIFKPLP